MAKVRNALVTNSSRESLQLAERFQLIVLYILCLCLKQRSYKIIPIDDLTAKPNQIISSALSQLIFINKE